MDFVVTPVRRARDTVLHVSGELDIATVKHLRTAVGQTLEDAPPVLVLDLSNTRFLDSTGCRELVRTAKAGRAGSTTVEVVAPPDNWRVRRVIDSVQLASILPVHAALPAP